jgi:hypothetical protein
MRMLCPCTFDLSQFAYLSRIALTLPCSPGNFRDLGIQYFPIGRQPVTAKISIQLPATWP